MERVAFVALRKDNQIYREFPDEMAMRFWFYGIKGSTLEHSYTPAKVTTIIEVLDNEQSS